MKIKHLISVALIVFFLTSCKDDEATIRIENKVPSVKLEQISFADRSIGYSILPGETATAIFSELWDGISFPLTSQVQFYMVKGDSRVFLKTKESYTLNVDQTLVIMISSDTEVVNMMVE